MGIRFSRARRSNSPIRPDPSRFNRFSRTRRAFRRHRTPRILTLPIRRSKPDQNRVKHIQRRD